MNTATIKPLGIKAYGSIPHLPGSRRGPADKGISESQARIATVKARDKHDLVTVQEKLDGSCVAVARLGAEIVPLVRSGYPARSSSYRQHHIFADWVQRREQKFRDLLVDGERVVGEWLAQAHGTRYDLPHDPFVAFDLMIEHDRSPVWEVAHRCSLGGFVVPKVLHSGGPLSVSSALEMLATSSHGAIDPVEGAVWRVERKGVVDFLCKFVRHDKVDGLYLESKTNAGPVWNWKP